MSNRIAVTKSGHEGGIHIDALTGQIVTPPEQRPDWAEGYAVALLGERTGWYEKRLGEQLSESIRKPDMIDASDLGWVGVDAEGDEVEIEASHEFRMDVLSGLLNIDRQDFDQERNFQNAIAQAELDHTYVTHATDEATLQEIEGTSFNEVAKAVNE